MEKKTPNRKKMAVLFEKKALSTISKLDGYKDLSEAQQKKFIKLLWRMLNNRALEIVQGKGITPQQALAQSKVKKEKNPLLPPSKLPPNIRTALDALSLYSGIGTAFAIGSKIAPLLLV